MQLFNKESAKKTFAHTWYIYPLTIGLITLVWIWGFQTFHLPSAHQMLTIFFATRISNTSFAKDIQKTYYAREDLRQVDVFHSLPTASGYYTKLQLYLQKGDMLVLDKKSIDDFKGYQEKFFVEFSDEFIQKYELDNYEFYTYLDNENIEHKYAVKLKNKTGNHYLDSCMTFDADYDYYITLSTSSKNLGYLGGKGNERYDNAITYMKHLLEL